ncbi:MAG TPA: hypothetical protein VIM51_10745 [Desulfosporosinus sp.]
MKKFTIGIIACLLPVFLLGCNQIPKTDDAASKPNVNDTHVVKPNESNSAAQAITPTPGVGVKTISEGQVLEIAKNTAPDLESIRQVWPEAKLDTVLCKIPLIHKNNTFFMYNPGYSDEMQVEAFAIGNKDDYSKMKIIYVDAFAKVIKNEYFAAKVTVKDAERIALEAAKKAKENVPYWKNAQIKYIRTSLMLCTPNYVFPMNDPNKKLEPVGTIMYEVCFMDTNAASSFLLIYVNATTGDIIGGKYTSD